MVPKIRKHRKRLYSLPKTPIRFLRVFGIQKTDVIQEIYQYIVETLPTT